MRYAWHPLYGCEVEVRTAERYRGVVRCFVPGEERRAKLLPEWMLDEAACARMHAAEDGSVSIAALEALVRLLAEAGTLDAALRPADGRGHEPTVEEEDAAARAHGARPTTPVMVGAAGRSAARGGRTAGEADAERAVRSRRGRGERR